MHQKNPNKSFTIKYDFYSFSYKSFIQNWHYSIFFIIISIKILLFITGEKRVDRRVQKVIMSTKEKKTEKRSSSQVWSSLKRSCRSADVKRNHWEPLREPPVEANMTLIMWHYMNILFPSSLIWNGHKIRAQISSKAQSGKGHCSCPVMILSAVLLIANQSYVRF